MSKEKKLTEKEQKRLKLFEQTSRDLQEQGYSINKLTVSPFMANVGSLLVTLPFVLIYLILFYFINKDNFREIIKTISFKLYFLFILAFIIFIVVHEMIHGITWGFFVKDKKSIEFGFNQAAMAPYCCCTKPLTKSQYIIGALMPTIILGFILGALSIHSANLFLFSCSCVMFIGGGGDFLMVINILKTKVNTKDVLYYDHPVEIGTVLFYR